MIEEFRKNNIDILKVYHCPHHPSENCNCRKPKIGMIEKAMSEYKIDLNHSWMIGDKTSDIQMAVNANIKNKILIDSLYTKDNNKIDSFIANSLFDTISIIKE